MYKFYLIFQTINGGTFMNNKYQQLLDEFFIYLEESGITDIDSKKFPDSILHIDPKVFSKRNKNDIILAFQTIILELHQENLRLKGQLTLTKALYEKYSSELISRYSQREEVLLKNPILTLPSGDQLQLSALNEEQLSYLESLASKQK